MAYKFIAANTNRIGFFPQDIINNLSHLTLLLRFTVSATKQEISTIYRESGGGPLLLFQINVGGSWDGQIRLWRVNDVNAGLKTFTFTNTIINEGKEHTLAYIARGFKPHELHLDGNLVQTDITELSGNLTTIAGAFGLGSGISQAFGGILVEAITLKTDILAKKIKQWHPCQKNKAVA